MINLNDVVPQNESVQKVFLTNPSGTAENPQKSEVTNIPMNGSNSVWVELKGTQVIRASLRPGTGQFNVSLDNILLLQSGGGFFAVPLSSYFTSLTNAQLTALLASYKTAYSTLVSGVTAATLHYSKVDAAGSVTSDTYNLKD